jgi:D-3-phosphoglycerate dehydrogenase
MFKILAIDTLHESIFALLKALPDVHIDYQPDWQRADILAHIAPYHAIIVRSKTPIDEAFIDKATHLKLIARAGSGLDLIDLSATQKRNITCLNAPEGNRDAVAEHTLGLLLNLLHKTSIGNAQVKEGKWLREANRGYELKGKTVGIVGYGNIGYQVAKRLKAFDCEVLAYDIRPKTYLTQEATLTDMSAIFEQADVITFHVPLTSETRHMVGKAYLDKFAKPIWLLNTSRGEVVQLEAVCEALEAGKLLGAGFDVLENEKINALTETQQKSFDYLAKSPQVILTPHIAGWTFESYQRINEVLVEKIKDFLTTEGFWEKQTTA